MILKDDRVAGAQSLMARYPKHRDQIVDLFQLMEDEIEDGESPEHEYEKFESDVKELASHD